MVIDMVLDGHVWTDKPKISPWKVIKAAPKIIDLAAMLSLVHASQHKVARRLIVIGAVVATVGIATGMAVTATKLLVVGGVTAVVVGIQIGFMEGVREANQAANGGG